MQLTSQVHWCLEKALERTLVGDKSGAYDYLVMAKLWQERTLAVPVEDKLAKYFIEPIE